MKYIIWLILAVTLTNSVVLIKDNSGLKHQIDSISSGSGPVPDLSGVQSSLDALNGSVNQLKTNNLLTKPSSTLTCTGSLNMDLSGSSIGSFTSFSGITPVDLTCNPL